MYQLAPLKKPLRRFEIDDQADVEEFLFSLKIQFYIRNKKDLVLKDKYEESPKK